MYGWPTVLSLRFMRAVESEHARLSARLEKEEERVRVPGAERAPGSPLIGAIKTQLVGLGLMLKKRPIELSGRDTADAQGALRGRAIREAAAALLVRRGFDAGPIHYRSWLGLLEESGRSVAGKRPDAVFLSQVVRHPLVRRTTRAGYYELDPDAVGRLESRVAELRGALATQWAHEGEDVPARPASSRRSQETHRELSRAERRLEEALVALSAADATAED